MPISRAQRSTSSASSSAVRPGMNPGGRTLVLNGLAADPTFAKLIIAGTGKGTTVSPLRAVSVAQGIDNVTLRPNVPNLPSLDATIYSTYIDQVWTKYASTTLTMFTSAFGTCSGQVNAQQQLVFTPPVGQADTTPIVIPKPAPGDVLEGYGTLINSCKPPPPNPQPTSYTICLEIASPLSAAFNRSTLLIDPTITRLYAAGQCKPAEYYGQAPTNLYSKLIHQNSLPLGGVPGTAPWGAAYGFGYDDNCNQSSFISDSNVQSMSITIEPF
jgi:Beta-1,3-glucanase